MSSARLQPVVSKPDGACCSAPSMTEEHGEKYCANCGTVPPQDITIADSFGIITHGDPSRRWERSRKMGTIPAGNRDAHGHAISRDFFRVRRTARWRRRHVREPVRQEVTALGAALLLPEHIIDGAQALLDRVIEKQVRVFASNGELAAAVVLYECRRRDYPRTLAEIATKIDVPKHLLGRVFKRLQWAIGAVGPAVNWERYLHRYAQQLGLSPAERAEAFRVAGTIIEATPGVLSYGAIGAGIYLAVQKERGTEGGAALTEWEIARAIGVTEVTIRTRKAWYLEHGRPSP